MVRGWSKNKKGFTITEIMITVAIIGTVSAVAIPGFMRIRMDTNMQLVKQHMRVIGEKMQEIYTNKGQFPEENRWPLTGTTDPDEMVITSNLSAIDAKGYTTNEYSRSTPATYQFCSSPATNTAGDKRFCVHCDPEMSALFAPGQVLEVPVTPIDMSPWIGDGANMVYDTNFWPNYYADVNNPGNRAVSLFFEASPSNAVTLLTNSLARSAYGHDYNESLRIANGTWQEGRHYSLRIVISSDQEDHYNQLMSQVYQQLESMGMNPVQAERSASYALSNCGPSWTCDNDRNQINANSDPKIYDVTVTLDEPIANPADFNAKYATTFPGFEDWWYEVTNGGRCPGPCV
ncbi:MAG: type II secretion system protein [Candidatus Omnitrophica bacterium]|nr:type II secretion system protein [Candidatus Omnitrophota bacterium]